MLCEIGGEHMKAIPKFDDTIRFGKDVYAFKKNAVASYPESVIDSLKNARDRFGNKAYPMSIVKRVKEVNKQKIK